jgi:lipoate-protein ligase A
MALDQALLEALPRLGTPVLRFYGWTEPAASFGYFQKYADAERATSLRPLVRRPTAGGLVAHDADWTYSLACPVTQAWYSLRAVESYRRMHEWIQSAFARLHVATELASDDRKGRPGQCFAGYERFDLLWRGRKIAGAAQRRTRDGLLIQGSVRPVMDREFSQLAASKSAQPAANNFVPAQLAEPLRFETNRGPAPLLSLARDDWQRAMCVVASAQGVGWNEFKLDAGLRARAAELEARKYASTGYNRKR